MHPREFSSIEALVEAAVSLWHATGEPAALILKESERYHRQLFMTPRPGPRTRNDGTSLPALSLSLNDCSPHIVNDGMKQSFYQNRA
jgi:hypothetical protein